MSLFSVLDTYTYWAIETGSLAWMGTYHHLCHLLGYRDWIIGLDENLHYHLLYNLMGYRDWIICLDENLHYHLYHLLGYRDWIIGLDGNLLSSFSFNSFFFLCLTCSIHNAGSLGAANSATIRCGNSIATPWSI